MNTASYKPKLIFSNNMGFFFQVSGISRMDKIRHRKALPFPMERTFQLFCFVLAKPELFCL